MTTEFQTDVSLNESNIVTIDIGKKLKAARIARDLDERQVATELKIPIDQVRALEDNRFDYFRSVTFARGYLKAYCRLLELNVQEFLKAFDTVTATVESESNIKPVDKVENKQASFGDPIVILISVVIIGVLVFLAFWWPTFSSKNPAEIQKSPTAEQTAPADNSAADQTATADTSVAPANGTTASSADATKVTTTSTTASTATPAQTNTTSDNTATNVQPTKEDGVTTGMSAETMALLEKSGVNPKQVEAATKEVVAQDVAAAKAGDSTGNAAPVQAPIYEDDIEIQFDADCWTEIRDSTDKILYSGVKTAGSKLGVTGKAPYRVVIGYAKGVTSFKYKGVTYDYSKYIHKDLARFELK